MVFPTARTRNSRARFMGVMCMYRYVFLIFFLSGCSSFFDTRANRLNNHGWQQISSNELPKNLVDETLCGDIDQNDLWFINQSEDYLACNKHPLDQTLCSRSGTSCYNLGDHGYQCWVSFPYGINLSQSSWNKNREKHFKEAELLKTEEQKRQEALIWATIDTGCK